MYPVMRGNYEKPPWEFCDRRGPFALDCRKDGRWDDLAGRYGPCLPCLDLLSGKHAARLNGWMNTTVDPKDTEPHYRQGPHVLSRRLNKANDRGTWIRGYVAQETLGQLHEDVHQIRQGCETYKALVDCGSAPPAARRRSWGSASSEPYSRCMPCRSPSRRRWPRSRTAPTWR